MKSNDVVMQVYAAVVRKAQKDAVARYSEEEYGSEIMRVYDVLTK